ncbi:hypothetical protein EVAR_9570_1 [Eumeta japonica]|uniref:Uncharacterized protein n=1 Tax=Eumeta variegata TaxID=151549 RepID=A0A4C1TMI2_EUMVA|nr:hypothetical protein EVAR_9570_1 [Eumeta japonica]
MRREKTAVCSKFAASVSIHARLTSRRGALEGVEGRKVPLNLAGMKGVRQAPADTSAAACGCRRVSALYQL